VILEGDVTDLAIASRLQTAAEATFGAPLVVVSRLINASNPLRQAFIRFREDRQFGDHCHGGVPNAQVIQELDSALKQAFPSRRIDVRGLLGTIPRPRVKSGWGISGRFLLELGAADLRIRICEVGCPRSEPGGDRAQRDYQGCRRTLSALGLGGIIQGQQPARRRFQDQSDWTL